MTGFYMKCNTAKMDQKHGYLLRKSNKYTVKALNSGHRVSKNSSVIKRFPLLGGSLTKIITFGTKHFVRYSMHVRYLGCPLLGGFTALYFLKKAPPSKKHCTIDTQIRTSASLYETPPCNKHPTSACVAY